MDAVEGDFLLVKVPSKKGKFVMNFVAKIVRRMQDGFEDMFSKRLHPSNRFQPTDEGSSFVTFSQIISILPKASQVQRYAVF